MAKITKIGMVREELSRIASTDDRQDAVTPTMKASWSFTRMMVIGKLKMQTFDFDSLRELLKTIPDGAGEKQFWNKADSLATAEPTASTSSVSTEIPKLKVEASTSPTTTKSSRSGGFLGMLSWVKRSQ